MDLDRHPPAQRRDGGRAGQSQGRVRAQAVRELQAQAAQARDLHAPVLDPRARHGDDAEGPAALGPGGDQQRHGDDRRDRRPARGRRSRRSAGAGRRRRARGRRRASTASRRMPRDVGVQAQAVALGGLRELAVERRAASAAAAGRCGVPSSSCGLDTFGAGRRHGLTLRPPPRHGNGSFLTLGLASCSWSRSSAVRRVRDTWTCEQPDPARDLGLAEVLHEAQLDDPALVRMQ